MAQSGSSLQFTTTTSNSFGPIYIPDHTHSIERIKCEWCGTLHIANNDRTRCSQCGGTMQGQLIQIGGAR